MKARIMGRTVEISDERMGKAKGGIAGSAYSPQGTCRLELTSGAAPSLPGWPKPTDKWNWSFCQFLDLERQAGRIKWFWYEPFSFWLVLPDRSKGERGVRHKVDFMIWYPDGMERRIQMVEVKGHSRNFRDGITRFKMARDKYPCFDWVIVKRRGHGWEEICL
ncbi:MAG: hypothetical protein OJF50_002492 [Nitrospira sp.]|nr:hypothetical protein [Nitrospira sp.]